MMARREISPKCPNCAEGFLTQNNHTAQVQIGSEIVVRRYRKCDTCHQNSTTVEMSEFSSRNHSERMRLALTLIDLCEKHLLARMRD